LGIGSKKLIANLPGGPLKLEWENYESSVIMDGPATYVFDAQIDASKIKTCLLV
jgi:diaminopimelate epimerase